MSAVTLDTARRRIDTGVRGVNALTEDGRDVILTLGEHPSPERVIKILHAAAGNLKIDLIVRHAELKEYIENSLVCASTGGITWWGGSSGGASNGQSYLLDSLS